MAAIKSVEEKAKAYDEAFRRAKEKYVEFEGMKQGNVLEDVFPELKESEDERIRGNIIATIHLYYGEPLEYEAKEMIAWLEKQGEQKPADTEKGAKGNDREIPNSAWSEEDETKIKSIIALLKSPSLCAMDGNKGIIDENIKYLNTLKERVQPQPKQEWSEEDEKTVNDIMWIIEAYRKNGFNETHLQIANNSETWLKSLRPQNWTKEDKERYISCLQKLSTGNPEQPETINSKWFKEHVYPQATWKPSDEQMHYLSWIANIKLGDSVVEQEVSKHLNELLEDLKKLRDE